jgi:hypothetical protein
VTNRGRVDRAIWVRLVIAVVLLVYAVIISLSHFIALPLFLGGVMALIGWLFLPGLYLWARLRRIDMSRAAQPSVNDLLRPLALTVAFGACAAVTLVLAIGWDVPNFCHGPVPVNCFRGYQWSTDTGRYYHTTADGTRAEISQQTYVQEVGFDMRSAASFGVYAMCLAWLAAGVLRAPSQPRKGLRPGQQVY